MPLLNAAEFPHFAADEYNDESPFHLSVMAGYTAHAGSITALVYTAT
jgi:hypothetical protein